MQHSGPSTLAALSALSRCFSSPESFYVLGAGASVPHVPTTEQLSKRLLGSFLEHGVFQTEPILRDVISSRVIRDPEYWKDPLKWELIQRLPPNYVIGKLPELLTTQSRVTSANYDVFALAAKPSTIFNMNVDRLAMRSCRGHRVFEPHGRSLSPEVFAQIGWSSYTEAILDFPELSPPTIPGLVLPGPEPAEILTRAVYRAAARLLPISKHFSIIGYSFGAMDDLHTYAFLTTRIPPTHQAVIVVSLDPYEMMHRLSDELQSTSVFAIAASWQYLSRAILYPGECKKFHPTPHGTFCVPCVWYQYETLLDAGSLS
jgi:hypothetical protein